MPDTPTPASVLPQRDPRVVDELLADGSMLVFQTASRTLMTLNPTAALVWEYCDGLHTPEAIAAEVRAIFPEVDAVTNDTAAIINNLRVAGMLRPPALEVL